MKIDCDVKDIVRFRDIKIGQCFREIGARSHYIEDIVCMYKVEFID